MSLDSQRKFLVSRMKQSGITIPVEYPNQPFDRPIGEPYARFDIMGGTPVIMGGQGTAKVRVRYVHMIQLTVWCPEGKGVAAATKSGDLFGKKFELAQGRDTEGEVYRFGALEPFAARIVSGDHVYVYRVAYTREGIRPAQPGFTL